MEETSKLYRIDTELRESYSVEYMTAMAYGTWERVQEKRSETIEKMLEDCSSPPYLGIHVKSKVTLIKDVGITLSRGSE